MLVLVSRLPGGTLLRRFTVSVVFFRLQCLPCDLGGRQESVVHGSV